LSTSLLDVRKKLSTGYNSSGAYILDASNANIIIGGKDVSCTGGRRGYTFAKNLSYNEDSSFRNKYRTIIPNQIKTELQLDDDEYGELYSQICNNKNVEDIKDITLASGKTIPKEDVINCINSIKEELVRPRREGESGYTNEIVVYNPKIEGEVTRFTPEQIDKFSNKERVYVIVK
jgi:phage pi2 protein 07